MSCPLCSSAAKEALVAKGIPILDCTDCGHRFYNVNATPFAPAEIYNDAYFDGGGAGYSDYRADRQLLVERGRMYARKLERFTSPGRILDVGAACGYILKGFVDEGWEGIGLEPNASMAAFAADDVGVAVRTGTLEETEIDGKFDLVSMIQVAAHFYDPAAAFARARGLLAENGLLLIETWDRASFSARILGKHWHEYSPPSVVHWFTPKGLTDFLSHNGFERIAGGRPSKWISGGHARSLLKYRLGERKILDLIPSWIKIPYPAEDLFWALFRKR
ncbi:MAG: type 11 methyltransferase [Acidobacteria bacterium OLB17]|nr:MAG: type 11 methyltransferase [Acidobacteria bacterium OLB17]MCZ2390916.1 class I SAM-dependent methyltransferase [Acidobacteriota bacterium]